MTETAVETGAPSSEAGNTQAADAAVKDQATLVTGEQPAASKAEEVAQAPESYELKMPEGVELDKAAADEFIAIAKELKLDQANAQKFADVGAKMAQRQIESHAKLVESWAEQVKTDKDIGGDKLQENLAVARKAIETFGTPDLKDVLNSTGLGNHPAFVKFAYQFGKAISEDKFVTGSPKGPETDMAKRMFPSMN